MTRFDASRIPKTSELIAFESVARVGNVSRAARELGLKQPAVSMQIASLERTLQVTLFHRLAKGVALTEAGRHYRQAVVTALRVLSVEGEQVSSVPGQRRLVITCSHDAAYLLLMPRHDALKAALGGAVDIRIKTYQRHKSELAEVPAADIQLKWGFGQARSGNSTLILRETVRPVCSPSYAEAHSDHVHSPTRGWGAARLLDLERPNQGWATWQDWFGVAGAPVMEPQRESFDSYTELLRAAAAGRGLALGWQHYVEPYLDSGRLVTIGDSWVEFPGRFTASLTRGGRRNILAHRCLEFLGGLRTHRGTTADNDGTSIAVSTDSGDREALA